MIKYSGEILIERGHLHMWHQAGELSNSNSGNDCLTSLFNLSSKASHRLLLIYSNVFTPAVAFLPFLLFFLALPLGPILLVLILQHNPIRLIVAVAINI